MFRTKRVSKAASPVDDAEAAGEDGDTLAKPLRDVAARMAGRPNVPAHGGSNSAAAVSALEAAALGDGDWEEF